MRGIQGARALEAGARLRDAAGLLVGECQREERALVRVVQRQRALVRGDRLRRTLRLLQQVPVQHVALDDRAVLRERAPHGVDALVDVAQRRLRARLLQEVVEPDRVLRVAPRAVLQVAGAPAAADVPEGGQALLRLGVERLRPRGRRGVRQAPLHLLQRAGQGRDPLRLLACEVARLARVLLQVEQLGPRRVDQLEAPVLHRAQLAPAVVVARVPALGVREQRHPLAARERSQVGALDRGRRRDAEPRQHGRHHVDRADLVGHHARRPARSRHHQRDARDRLVDEVPVRLLGALAQHLAVVARDHDQRVLPASRRARPADAPAARRRTRSPRRTRRPASRESGTARARAPRTARAGRRGAPRRRTAACGPRPARRAPGRPPRCPAAGSRPCPASP